MVPHGDASKTASAATGTGGRSDWLSLSEAYRRPYGHLSCGGAGCQQLYGTSPGGSGAPHGEQARLARGTVSIAGGIGVIGDGWTLLILRELLSGARYLGDRQSQRTTSTASA